MQPNNPIKAEYYKQKGIVPSTEVRPIFIKNVHTKDIPQGTIYNVTDHDGTIYSYLPRDKDYGWEKYLLPGLAIETFLVRKTKGDKTYNNIYPSAGEPYPYLPEHVYDPFGWGKKIASDEELENYKQSLNQ